MLSYLERGEEKSKGLEDSLKANEVSQLSLNNQIDMLTNSLNEARAANAQVITQASSPVGSGEKVDEDTLREIENNNV